MKWTAEQRKNNRQNESVVLRKRAPTLFLGEIRSALDHGNTAAHVHLGVTAVFHNEAEMRSARLQGRAKIVDFTWAFQHDLATMAERHDGDDAGATPRRGNRDLRFVPLPFPKLSFVAKI